VKRDGIENQRGRAHDLRLSKRQDRTARIFQERGKKVKRAGGGRPAGMLSTLEKKQLSRPDAENSEKIKETGKETALE